MRKERELYYLKKAQALYPELPQTTPILSESLDFLFQKDSKVLGIEVTQYIRRLKSGSVTLRTIEKLHAMVAQQAKAKFESKHGIPIWVTLHWNKRFKFTTKDVDSIATELTEMIETEIPSLPYGSATFDWESHGNLSIFEAIHRIRVRRLRDGAKGVWSEIEAGFIGGRTIDIQIIIDAKEPKLDKYLSRCDEVYLLVVADGRHISSTFDLEDFDDSTILRTKFGRVLVYAAESNKVTSMT